MDTNIRYYGLSVASLRCGNARMIVRSTQKNTNRGGSMINAAVVGLGTWGKTMVELAEAAT